MEVFKVKLYVSVARLHSEAIEYTNVTNLLVFEAASWPLSDSINKQHWQTCSLRSPSHERRWYVYSSPLLEAWQRLAVALGSYHRSRVTGLGCQEGSVQAIQMRVREVEDKHEELMISHVARVWQRP